jgi:hypothetical protein
MIRVLSDTLDVFGESGTSNSKRFLMTVRKSFAGGSLVSS